MPLLSDVPTYEEIADALEDAGGFTVELDGNSVKFFYSTSRFMSVFGSIEGVNEKQLLTDLLISDSYSAKPASIQSLNDAICEMSMSVQAKELTEGQWSSGAYLVDANCDKGGGNEDDIEFGGDFLISTKREQFRISYSSLEDLPDELEDILVDEGESLSKIGKSLVKTAEDK